MSDNHPNRLILLASSQTYRNSPFQKAAKKLGLDLVLGDDIPLPMLENSNSTLALDYRDIKKSTQLIKDYVKNKPVGAILGLDDSGTLIAASASAELGLNHNSYDSAMAARDKHIMRQCFAENNLPSPNFEHHHISEDLAALADDVNYPCVIKPTTLSGSKGVMRANDPEEFLIRVDRLKKILDGDRCDEFLIEDYIPGVEVALEGLLDDGNLLVLALFDKPEPLEGPFFEESVYITPSRLTQEAQDEIIETTIKAAKALGLSQGPIHAELRYNAEGAWLLEVAARSIGGLCSQTLRFDTEATLEELILRQAFKMDLSAAKRTSGADGVMMIPIPTHGLLKDIKGLDEAKEVANIDDIEITAPFNYPLLPLPEGNSYLGFIFASGETTEEVEEALHKAHGLLKFKIMPEIKLKEEITNN